MQGLQGTEKDIQVWLQGLQRMQGTETDKRQVWLQGFQRLQGTETDRQKGMVVRVTRYRDRETDRYGCKGSKGCKVERQIDRQVWLQGLQKL